MSSAPNVHSVQFSEGDLRWLSEMFAQVHGLKEFIGSLDPEFVKDVLSGGYLLCQRHQEIRRQRHLVRSQPGRR
jgi:hypothetical protein